MSGDALQPLSDSLKQVDLTGHPPVDKWNPAYEGEIDIVIKADGTWLHEGRPFKRESLVKLFASVLWFENGRHYLKTPAEKMLITVEEAAFFAPLLDVVEAGTDQQQLIFTTQYGDKVMADAQHPIMVEEDPNSGEPRPYLGMRYGMRAKLSRNVFYQLAELAVLQPASAESSKQAEDKRSSECLVVYSAGKAFVLGAAE